MSNFGAQNPYQQGYGQQQPQGMGGYGQPQYGSQPMPNPMGVGATGGMPAPVRRGTSKALPIMVAAGLAVGVCGGLVLVLGTGESKAAAAAAEDKGASNETEKVNEVKDTTGVAATDKETETKQAETPVEKEPEKPKVAEITIDFKVEPSDAEISVNGEEISGTSYMVELEEGKTQKVTIETKASGYKTATQDYEIAKNDTLEISLEKRKRSSSSSSSSSGSSKKPKSKKPKGSGTLIDL